MSAAEHRPTIVLTVQAPLPDVDHADVRIRNQLYADAIAGAGGEPVLLDELSGDHERAALFARMDGLLLSGGADLDPARYGQERDGTDRVEPGRDALELEAWRAARERRVPILGICRGFQAINVFSGGALVQHVDGHRRPGAALNALPVHPLTVERGTRLAEILGVEESSAAPVSVNSSHHQAVRADGVAPDLVIAGRSPHDDGELVEAIEARDRGDWLIGVQCHPERTETTPPSFERLWSTFCDAARGSARRPLRR